MFWGLHVSRRLFWFNWVRSWAAGFRFGSSRRVGLPDLYSAELHAASLFYTANVTGGTVSCSYVRVDAAVPAQNAALGPIGNCTCSAARVFTARFWVGSCSFTQLRATKTDPLEPPLQKLAVAGFWRWPGKGGHWDVLDVSLLHARSTTQQVPVDTVDALRAATWRTKTAGSIVRPVRRRVRGGARNRRAPGSNAAQLVEAAAHGRCTTCCAHSGAHDR